MQPPGFVVLLGLSVSLAAAHAADATSPVDYTQRNTPLAPGTAPVQPAKRAPAKNSALQERRVTLPRMERQPAAVGDRRAPIALTEANEKQVREKTVRAPEMVTPPRSRLDQQTASVTTQQRAGKPPLMAKYQDSLTAATVSNMARFPAMDRGTTAKINRFVFRKNPPEGGIANGAAPVIPAGGGAITK